MGVKRIFRRVIPDDAGPSADRDHRGRSGLADPETSGRVVRRRAAGLLVLGQSRRDARQGRPHPCL